MSSIYLTSLISKFREDLKSDCEADKCAALFFALQLPGVCSRYEFPFERTGTKHNNIELYKSNGEPRDGSLYCHWIVRHREYFKYFWYGNMSPYEFAKAVYALRNGVIHKGSIKDVKSDKRIIFVDDNEDGIVSASLYFVSVERFCTAIFNAAQYVLDEFGATFNGHDCLILPSDIYSMIKLVVNANGSYFWSQRSEYDKQLYRDAMIYNAPRFSSVQEMADSFMKSSDETSRYLGKLIKDVEQSFEDTDRDIVDNCLDVNSKK